MTDRVTLRHPIVEGTWECPNDADTLAHWRERGWAPVAEAAPTETAAPSARPKREEK